MEIFRLFGSIFVKDEASKEIDKVENKSDSASEKITSAFKKIGSAIVAAFAFDKIKDFFVNIVQNTSELEALRSQYEQVMGGMKDTTDTYLNDMSKKWNKHPNELKSTMMQYYALLKSKGLSEKDAYETAQKYMERTVDANAFANESMEDTTARFMAMMKGEYSSIDTAMINLNATMLDTAAQEKYGKSLKDITETEKQLLISEIALKQHQDSGVFGQGARESNSYANNMAMLKETWKEFTTIIGTPILEKVNTILSNGVQVIGYLTNIVTNYSTELKVLGIILGTVATAIGAYNLALNWTAISTGIVTAATTAFGAVMAFVTSPIGIVVLAIGSLIAIFVLLWEKCDGFRTFVSKMWDDVKTKTSQVLEKYIVPFIRDQLVPLFQKSFQTVGDVVKGAFEVMQWCWDNILNPLFVNTIIPYIQNVLLPTWKLVFGGIGDAVSIIFSSIGDLWENSLKPIFNGILDFISGVFTGDWKRAWEGIVSIFGGIFKGIKELFTIPINFIITGLNKFINGINKIKIPDWVSGIGGKGINIPSIPMLANGTENFQGGYAIVGELGPELVRLPKGTSVTPTNETKEILGGINITIENFVNNRKQDVQAFAEELEFYRRQSALAKGGVY